MSPAVSLQKKEFTDIRAARVDHGRFLTPRPPVPLACPRDIGGFARSLSPSLSPLGHKCRRSSPCRSFRVVRISRAAVRSSLAPFAARRSDLGHKHAKPIRINSNESETSGGHHPLVRTCDLRGGRQCGQPPPSRYPRADGRCHSRARAGRVGDWPTRGTLLIARAPAAVRNAVQWNVICGTQGAVPLLRASRASEIRNRPAPRNGGRVSVARSRYVVVERRSRRDFGRQRQVFLPGVGIDDFLGLTFVFATYKGCSLFVSDGWRNSERHFVARRMKSTPIVSTIFNI